MSSALASIKEERKELGQYHQLMYSRKSDLGILRNSLMHDLLLGREIPRPSLEHKCMNTRSRYEQTGGRSSLIQLGQKFTRMDDHSVGLMEYAIGNIAEEVFAERSMCGQQNAA